MKYKPILLFTILLLAISTIHEFRELSPLKQSHTHQQQIHHAILNDNTYTDENITIELTRTNLNTVQLYHAKIHLEQPSYLKHSLFSDTSSRLNLTHRAILSMSGDICFNTDGIVLRNGILYQNQPTQGKTAFTIDHNGMMAFIDETEIQQSQHDYLHVYTNGTALIQDGQMVPFDSNQPCSHGILAMNQANQPSFIIAQCQQECDMETIQSYLYSEKIQAAYQLNCENPLMFFNGRPVNESRQSEERSVSGIVYIGYA